MSKKIEYKGKITRLFVYWISMNGLTTLVCLFGGTLFNTIFVLLGVLNLAYLASVFGKPFKLIVYPEILLFEVHYLLGPFKKPLVVSVHELECSFNFELRARGSRARVLRIVYANKTIVELLPNFNGWDERSLDQVHEILNDLKKLN